MKEAMNDLKIEELKYRKLYDRRANTKYILDGLKADAFKIAIQKLESKGLKETYSWFKKNRDENLKELSVLSINLAHAYGLVVGKLWKYYKKLE